MQNIVRHPSSFRDPAGTVYTSGNRIIRGLTDEGFARYSVVKNSGLLDSLIKTNKVISSHELTEVGEGSNYVKFLEHELIEFISYPYEWPFLLLKEAALHHLAIQITALKHEISLIDASAYNIQFKGVNPIFIDVLSFKSYQTGEFWNAHRQFCEHFLNPLLLYAIKNIPYHDWYRGSMEGVSTEMLARLLPSRSWFSLNYLVHILLPAHNQNKSKKTNDRIVSRSHYHQFPKSIYLRFLEQLHRWIQKLQLKSQQMTTWEDYTTTRFYTEKQLIEKREFISEFVKATKPKQLWDLGCNDGEFAQIALKNGAGYVIGFDADLGALDKAVIRAKQNNLNFLPLYQQISNLTPNQGWLSKERLSILDRGAPNALIALALIHHLALGHNLPLNEIIQLLTSISPCGVVEFVPKTDPTAQKMLALKGDCFPHYTEQNFQRILAEQSSIVKTLTLSESGRTLYWYHAK